MDLNILNNVKIGTKGSDFIFSFIDEITNKLKNEKEKENDMNVQYCESLTTQNRDRFVLERNKILLNYAKETEEKGTMYYIYSKNSNDENTYNATICEDERSHEIVEFNKQQLPENVSIGSVLRNNNGEYYVDETATMEIQNKLDEVTEQLLQQQTKELENNRIEGHIYEVSEIGTDRVYLFDITQDDSNGVDEIEETGISEELLNSINEGDTLIYQNGQYILNNK